MNTLATSIEWVAVDPVIWGRSRVSYLWEGSLGGVGNGSVMRGIVSSTAISVYMEAFTEYIQPTRTTYPANKIAK